MNPQWSLNKEEGIEALATEISTNLQQGKRVLWLVAGGTNIPIAAEAFLRIEKIVSSELLSNLTLSQTDERYGPVGHADSNWQQLTEQHVDFSKIHTVPVLTRLQLQETVAEWSARIKPLLSGSDVIIGQFGIGADGHLAGILPHTVASKITGKETVAKDQTQTQTQTPSEAQVAVGYQGGEFVRISLTFPELRRINSAYLFAFGDSKKEALAKLLEPLSLDEEPAQILKELPSLKIYSDFLPT
jgi:6-phosphogluconolactonase/glucosamine-6-phosphate isomerase/deaminase